MALIKTFKRVPNFEKGRRGHLPEIIVLHIGEGNKNQIWSEFLNAEKSSHYLVNKDGSCWQFVSDEDTAWANGEINEPTSEIVKSHRKLNPNYYSLSIEHEGYGNADITSKQYDTTIQLIKELCRKWNILIDKKHIIGHREIKKTKTCPGLISVARIIIEASKPAILSPLTPDDTPWFIKWFNKRW